MIHILLAILLMTPPPLGLNWDKKIDTSNKLSIQDYRYYTGKITPGPLVYLGASTLMGMETELQLFIADGLLTRAILILGPKGLDDENCLQKFNIHVKLLSGKYGKPAFKKTETSFLEEELFYTHECYLYRRELKRKRVFWKTKKFNIETMLIGDSEGFYIETVYTNRKVSKLNFEKNRKIIYRKISRKEKKK